MRTSRSSRYILVVALAVVVAGGCDARSTSTGQSARSAPGAAAATSMGAPAQPGGTTRASGPRPIVVQGAMEVEVNELIAALEQPTVETHSGYTFWRGTLGGYPVIVSKTQKGMINASASTALAIELYQPAAMINQGTSGGHDPALKARDIVLGTTAVNIGAFKTGFREKGKGSAFSEWSPMDLLRTDGSAGQDPDAWVARTFAGDPGLLAAARSHPRLFPRQPRTEAHRSHPSRYGRRRLSRAARPRAPLLQTSHCDVDADSGRVQMTSAVFQQWFAACGVAVLIGGGGLSASSQAEPRQSSPAQDRAPGSTQTKPTADEIMVTGCLAAENAAGQFVLTDATLTAEAKSAGNMPPNRAAAETDQVRKTPARYRLTGGDLNAHVGHRVQVTGTLDETAPPRVGGAGAPGTTREPVGTSGSASSTPAPGTDRMPRTDEDARTIHVREVKPLQGTCS